MLYFLGYEAKRSVGPVKKQGKRRGPDYWAIPDDTLVRPTDILWSGENHSRHFVSRVICRSS